MSSWPGVLGVDLLPLAAHPVGVEPAGHRQALGVVADGQVRVAARPGPPRPSAATVRGAVAPARVGVQVAAQVGALDQPRQRALRAASISPRSSRSSGGTVEPEGRVDLLLVGVRGARRRPQRCRAGRPTAPAARRSSRRRTLWAAEPGGVLQQVAEGLGRADRQLQPHPGVGRHRAGSRRRATAPARPPGGRARAAWSSSGRSAPRPGRCRARSRGRAAGCRRPRPARRAPPRAGSRAISSATGRARPMRDALLVVGLGLGAPGELGRDARLGPGAEARHRRARGRRRSRGDGRRHAATPSSRQSAVARLGRCRRGARRSARPTGTRSRELGQRGDVAGLDELDDLRLEGRADVGEVTARPRIAISATEVWVERMRAAARR